jgi:hypothetical protein
MSLACTTSILSIFTLCSLLDFAAAQTAPLPRPRPQNSDANRTGAPSLAPSACRIRLATERVIASSIDDIKGPDGCGGEDMVRLEAVVLPNEGGRIEITPPAVLRCSMAEKIADWVRNDLADLTLNTFGARPRSIRNYAAYHCRGRNNIVGGILSEHGKGNALDIGPITLSNGQTIDPTNLTVPHDFRERWKKSVCSLFSTVLGPGSDGYHENHVHLDFKERRREYPSICQWDIRLPEEPPGTNHVPIPQPRPK